MGTQTNWKTLNGMLISDGSNTDMRAWIAAPFDPRDMADYAVEAEIQFISAGANYGNNAFGIVVREGYMAGVSFDTVYNFDDACITTGGVSVQSTVTR